MSIHVPVVSYKEIITPAVKIAVEKNPRLKATNQAGVTFLCDVSDIHDQQVEVNIHPENSEQNLILLARLDAQLALMKIKTELLKNISDIRGKLQNCFQRENMEGDVKGPFYDYFLLNDISGSFESLLALMALFDNDTELNDATRRNVAKFEQYLLQYQRILQSEPLIMAAQSVNEVNTVRKEAGMGECLVGSLLAEHSQKISIALPVSHDRAEEEGVSEKNKRKLSDLELDGIYLSPLTRSALVNKAYLSGTLLSPQQRDALREALNCRYSRKGKSEFRERGFDPLISFHDCLLSRGSLNILPGESPIPMALLVVSGTVSELIYRIKNEQCKNRDHFIRNCESLVRYFLLFVNTAFERVLHSTSIEEIRFIVSVISQLFDMLSVYFESVEYEGLHPELHVFSDKAFKSFLAGLEGGIPIPEVARMLHIIEMAIYNGGSENDMFLVKNKQKATRELGFLIRSWMTNVLEYTQKKRDRDFPQAISAELPISIGLSFVLRGDKQ